MGLVTADWTNGGIGYTPLSCTSAGCGITGVTHTALTAYTHPSIPRGVDLGLFGLQAPSVVHLNSGTWVMYYGAVDAGSPHNAYAVWVATATHPTAVDGFTSSLTEGPIMYQKTTGGSTDPSVFTSPSGTRSLQWKSSTYRTDGDKARLVVDAAHRHRAPDFRQRAQSSSPSPTTGWDSATVENPDMIYSGGTYYLFFSGGFWWTTGYAEGYVTCRRPTGGCGSRPPPRSFAHHAASPTVPAGPRLSRASQAAGRSPTTGGTRAAPRTSHRGDGSRQLYVSPTTGRRPPAAQDHIVRGQPVLVALDRGTVTLSVISPDMTNYSISSSPAVAGLPAERPTIHLPANTTGSPITYTFTATTNNTAGFQTATASVTVAAKPPPPTITSVSWASTSTLPGK